MGLYSRVEGHAANYGTPVIGPSQGLVGKLIRRNKLGIALNIITPSALAEAMLGAEPYGLITDYKNQITVPRFLDSLFLYF